MQPPPNCNLFLVMYVSVLWQILHRPPSSELRYRTCKCTVLQNSEHTELKYTVNKDTVLISFYKVLETALKYLGIYDASVLKTHFEKFPPYYYLTMPKLS